MLLPPGSPPVPLRLGLVPPSALIASLVLLFARWTALQVLSHVS